MSRVMSSSTRGPTPYWNETSRSRTLLLVAVLGSSAASATEMAAMPIMRFRDAAAAWMVSMTNSTWLIGPSRRSTSSMAVVAPPTVEVPESMRMKPTTRMAARLRHSARFRRALSMLCTVRARNACTATAQEAVSTVRWRCSPSPKPSTVA
jgi:hypothetical protein